MKKILLITLLSVLFLNISCEKDKTVVEAYEKHLGSYKIIAFESNIEVDLNDDSITSTNLMNEIYILEYNYGQNLEIMTSQNPRDNWSKLISLGLPKTELTFECCPEGFTSFNWYGYSISSEFENDTFFLEKKNHIEEGYIDNVQSDKAVTIKNDLEIIDDTHMKLLITKEYYDFRTANWIPLDIEIIYEKVL